MNNNQGFAEWVGGFITLIAVGISLYLARRSESIIEKQRQKEKYENIYHSILEALAEFSTATVAFTKQSELDLMNKKGQHVRYYENLSDRPNQKYLKTLSDYSAKWGNDWRLKFLIKELLTEKEHSKFSSIMDNGLQDKFKLLNQVDSGKEVIEICYGSSAEEGINGNITELMDIVIDSYNKNNK